MLDSPELMWAEPQLEPVYSAVRSYLEMDQRVGLLTERLDVIADLLAVLKDQVRTTHGEYLEWIGERASGLCLISYHPFFSLPSSELMESKSLLPTPLPKPDTYIGNKTANNRLPHSHHSHRSRDPRRSHQHRRRYIRRY